MHRSKEEGQTIHWSKEEGRIIHWSKEEGRTIHWLKEEGRTIHWSKEKKTNTDLQSTTENKKSNTNQLINGLIVAYDTMRGCNGRDRIVVAFTTSCAINVYYH